MKCQVLVKSFINGRIYDPATSDEPIFVEYEGAIGANLKPVGPGQAKKKPDPKVSAARLHAAAESENPDLAQA